MVCGCDGGIGGRLLRLVGLWRSGAGRHLCRMRMQNQIVGMVMEVERCRGGSAVCERVMTRWWVKAAIWAVI